MICLLNNKERKSILGKKKEWEKSSSLVFTRNGKKKQGSTVSNN